MFVKRAGQLNTNDWAGDQKFRTEYVVSTLVFSQILLFTKSVQKALFSSAVNVNVNLFLLSLTTAQRNLSDPHASALCIPYIADDCSSSSACKQLKHGLCKPLPAAAAGGYFRSNCACAAGFHMQENACVDLDECVTTYPCSQQCRNLPGTFHCSCEDGWRKAVRGFPWWWNKVLHHTKRCFVMS